MKTLRLKNPIKGQENNEYFSGDKYFINKLNEVIGVAPKYFELAAADWQLNDIESSDLFIPSKLVVVGYSENGTQLTKWEDEN